MDGLTEEDILSGHSWKSAGEEGVIIREGEDGGRNDVINNIAVNGLSDDDILKGHWTNSLVEGEEKVEGLIQSNIMNSPAAVNIVNDAAISNEGEDYINDPVDMYGFQRVVDNNGGGGGGGGGVKEEEKEEITYHSALDDKKYDPSVIDPIDIYGFKRVVDNNNNNYDKGILNSLKKKVGGLFQEPIEGSVTPLDDTSALTTVAPLDIPVVADEPELLQETPPLDTSLHIVMDEPEILQETGAVDTGDVEKKKMEDPYDLWLEANGFPPQVVPTPKPTPSGDNALLVVIDMLETAKYMLENHIQQEADAAV